MNNWFLPGVKYEKILECGKQKKVVEYYLVDALSFTECEARIIEEIKPFISGEFEVVSIKKEKISEIFFNENGDRFYKAKINFITLDERSGAEKKTAAYMMMQACNIEDAKNVLIEGMKGTLADYVIESIKETKIMDVYIYGNIGDRKNE